LREQFGDANAKAQDHQLHLRTRDKSYLKVDSLSIEAAAAAANNRWPCALRQQTSWPCSSTGIMIRHIGERSSGTARKTRPRNRWPLFRPRATRLGHRWGLL